MRFIKMIESKRISNIIIDFNLEKDNLIKNIKDVDTLNNLNFIDEYDTAKHATDLFKSLSDSALSSDMINLKNEIIDKIYQLESYIQYKNNEIIENNIKINQEKNTLVKNTELLITQNNIDYKKVVDNNINFNHSLIINYCNIPVEAIKCLREIYKSHKLFYATDNNTDYIFFNPDITTDKILVIDISNDFNLTTHKQNLDIYINGYFCRSNINIYNPNNPIIIKILEKIENY